MTEPKRNSNPFVRLAQEAKAKAAHQHPIVENKPQSSISAPKPTKGFGEKIIKKTGRA